MSWIVYRVEQIIQRGEKLWEPGRLSGTLFIEQVRTLEHLVGQTSGVVDLYCDEMHVDTFALGLFIERVLDFLEHTNSGPIFAMVEGCLAICIALNQRIAGRWPEVSDRLMPIVERAKTVMEPIPDENEGS